MNRAGERALPDLILLTGPTGSGKTQLVCSLDSNLFEVISFDSRQVYKDLPIGTACPSIEEQGRMPHALVEFLSSDQSMDAKEFSELAHQAYQRILEKGKVPILVAGTGFYLKAFLYGMYPIPDVSEEVHQAVLDLPDELVVAELKEKDPEAFQEISSNDFYRYRRALEVCRTSGSLTRFKQETIGGLLRSKDKFNVLGFFLDWDREILYSRINTRARNLLIPMAEEAKLVREKYSADCPGLKTLGYNFALDFLDEKMSLDSFYEGIAKAHRNYAKRQITWFKKEPLLQKVSWDFAMEKLQEVQLLVIKNK
ncbi:MAG: tRNA (adenosine(37)-N6)-dimethylallyltransferase MiaA [Leptospira sp.]|jgi:tRNA dimethylallyltransferase|nr:MAG: tRNA (adenosine(37)-N6)-dimethylallyltransferase MiaA [Leptospira sp.]